MVKPKQHQLFTDVEQVDKPAADCLMLITDQQ